MSVSSIKPKYQRLLILTYGLLAAVFYTFATAAVAWDMPQIGIPCLILAFICLYRSGLESGRYRSR
ncbi:MAG: hypothetical protein WD603_01025 [Patescibacteria group bacterium]